MIEVRDLVKQYGDHVAVDHLSFTVEKGQIYGFLGPNGAGKSTTMNIMTGYIGATEGEVIINGHNTIDEPEAAKKCIGYLPEIPPLYSDMTVYEYLTFAAELKKVPKAEIEAEVARVAAATHLEEMFDRLTANLSKGYKQRVGVAQAIIGSPDIVILDEPTIGLDPTQILEMRELIRSLGKQHTVIISSHILAEIQAVCDQVLIINHGRLVATGTPAELEAQLSSSSAEVTVKASDADKVISTLSAIDGVIRTELCPSEEGEVSVKLSVRKGADVREAIFNVCVASNMPMLALSAGETSLERVFIELVKEDSDK